MPRFLAAGLGLFLATTGCAPSTGSEVSVAEEAGHIDPSVPAGAFQRVAWRVLSELQRGHEHTVPLNVFRVALFEHCAPDRPSCEWVSREVPLPAHLQQALREFDQPIRFVPAPQPLCRNEVAIGFTDAQVISDGQYTITIDLVDTRPPAPYLEVHREYAVECNPNYCEIRSITPGEEPDVELRFSDAEACASRDVLP